MHRELACTYYSKGHTQCWFDISIEVGDSQNTFLYGVLQLLGRKLAQLERYRV